MKAAPGSDRRVAAGREFLPPYILNRLLEGERGEARKSLLDSIEASAEARTSRVLMSMMPRTAAVPSPKGQKFRLVYDLEHRPPHLLPGRLVREEGGKAVDDRAANQAYRGMGRVYDFYRKVLGRNSLDGKGMTLISTVHVGKNYSNAFWNGRQIAFGDGDGVYFRNFTRSLDVIAHEMTHGVIAHTAGFEYHGQPGALSEHFADVFGTLADQWSRKETSADADWMVGKGVMGPGLKARALRTFGREKAFVNDPHLGTDPQPKHMDDLYTGEEDRGGVHINSGIPNHAFYRTSRALGGNAWETGGRIWYEALQSLSPLSNFNAAAAATLQAASTLFPGKRKILGAVRKGWTAVGVNAR